ncbi:MAG TPA: helix-turn-helix domain-containing protein [Sphingomicrobium sp.]|nr:helix-turn-helix domain-containing protein [Sphingomicrobium sp.]
MPEEYNARAMNSPTLIRTCSIWRALEVVGDTPTLLLLEAIWLGEHRFDGLRDRTGLLKALLSDRLKRLVTAGLLRKQLYCESPPRYAYVMTDKGRGIYWTSLMLLRWETRWNEGKNKIAIELTHSKCGKRFTPEPACGSCGETIDATQVEWEEGPGVGWMKPVYSRRRQQRQSSEAATSLMQESAQIMGDRWASLILRSIFTGITRFEAIRADSGIATNILAERLNWLKSIGVVRAETSEGVRRHEYRLTRKGVEYYPVLLMLMKWGDTHYVSPAGAPLLLQHKNCGKPLDPQVVCSECRQPVSPEEVTYAIIERQQLAAAK